MLSLSFYFLRYVFFCTMKNVPFPDVQDGGFLKADSNNFCVYTSFIYISDKGNFRYMYA